MIHKRLLLATAAFCVLSICSCGNSDQPPVTTTPPPPPPVVVALPTFNADSAYHYIEQQVAFGPRVPGTKAQKQCAALMEASLRKSCDTVYRQETTVTAGDGKLLPCINLVGVINSGAARRILLLTHWDSRPWADQDTKDQDKPILAADDGGSGTAVLMEIARQVKDFHLPPSIGIDILLTDVEDYGKTEWGDESYCLGTQHWANNPHVAGYKATFGILLDMVGARGAQFPLEAGSAEMAGEIQQRVWKAAGDVGFSSWFPYTPGPQIIDDHVP